MEAKGLLIGAKARGKRSNGSMVHDGSAPLTPPYGGTTSGSATMRTEHNL
jgi:hypothetical protein